jgi:hypothetical protein
MQEPWIAHTAYIHKQYRILRGITLYMIQEVRMPRMTLFRGFYTWYSTAPLTRVLFNNSLKEFSSLFSSSFQTSFFPSFEHLELPRTQLVGVDRRGCAREALHAQLMVTTTAAGLPYTAARSSRIRFGRCTRVMDGMSVSMSYLA